MQAGQYPRLGKRLVFSHHVSNLSLLTTPFIQFTPADMQSAIASANTPPPPPPVPNESRPTNTFNFGTQAPAPPVPSGSKPKGMQLGSHKAIGVLPGGLGLGEEEVRWDGDLMDVNADADDWSTYPPPSHTHSPNPQLSKIPLLFIDAFESAAPHDEDPWGAFEDPAPPPIPIPVTELTNASSTLTLSPAARMHTQSAARPSRIVALTPSTSPRSTPLASPAPSSEGGPTTPLHASPKVGMTKEEKAAEMARRKEERKQVRSVSFYRRYADEHCIRRGLHS